jgi:large subunit ribosomal protein L21
MYAIVKTGGKQYRIEQGQSLLIERLPESDGSTVALQPLLYVDGSDVLDGDDLSKVKISARIVAHERGPKLRVVKFKPKRGYKRRTGHRQELTRIEVTEIKLGSGRAARSSAAKAPAEASADAPGASKPASETKAPKPASETKAPKPASETKAPKPASETKAPARASRARAKPAASDPADSDPQKEGGDGT